LPHLKSGNEKYELAIQGNKLIAAPVEELKEVLRLVMLKLGIRGHNLPDAEEKQILITHIIENYGYHTAEEIKLAFDLAFAGKLYVDAKVYENFSCLYFSTIMNAYRTWSIEPNYAISQKKRRLTLPYQERGNLTENEMEEWIEEWCTKIPEHNRQINYVPLMFYDYLVAKCYLKLTNEEKKEYFQKAMDAHELQLYNYFISNTAHQREYDNFITEKKENKFSYPINTTIQNLAKKIAVFDYLKNKENEMCNTSE